MFEADLKMSETKKRKVWEDDITCPYCDELVHVKVERETIVPAEPAEVELRVSVEKSRQAKLQEAIQ